ncbi:MAG TPA: hypothetical protein VIV15_11380 [Anaerolineales bacterium]
MTEDFIPGDANRTISLKIIQAPIEFGTLGLGQRHGCRVGGQTVP